MSVGQPRWRLPATCSTACWTWDARTTSATPEHVGAGVSAAAPLIPAPRCGARAFAHSGEGLAAMAAWILELTGAAPEAVFVAIEVPHGPVVESLMERGFRVHAIN